MNHKPGSVTKSQRLLVLKFCQAKPQCNHPKIGFTLLPSILDRHYNRPPCSLPATLDGPPCCCLTLLLMRFALFRLTGIFSAALPLPRRALTPPFHPYPAPVFLHDGKMENHNSRQKNRRWAVYFLLHFLSQPLIFLQAAGPGYYPASCPAEPGLSSASTFRLDRQVLAAAAWFIVNYSFIFVDNYLFIFFFIFIIFFVFHIIKIRKTAGIFVVEEFFLFLF